MKFNEGTEYVIDRRLPPDISIAKQVMAGVSAFFRVHKHNPSADVLDALEDIPRTVEKIIMGKATPAMYLCALDVGMGKTTTLKYTTAALMQPGYDIGMVLCLGRLEQIETAIKDLELDDYEYAVLAGKDALTKADGPFKGKPFAELGKGEERTNEAPILFTTHSQVELRLQHHDWTNAKIFYYANAPRLIRIWDEACEFRRHFSISDNELHQIAGTRDAPRELKEYAELILQVIKKAVPGADIAIPEAVGLPDMFEVLEGLPDVDYKKIAEPVRNLMALSGKQRAGLRRSERDLAVIQFDMRLPPDLLPMIVLDASAHDREAYKQAIEEIVPLRYVEKRYDKVKIHVKNGNSGRRAFWNNAPERCREAAEIIKQHPERKVLIIHPKETLRRDRGTVKEGIERALGPDHGRDISYVWWGIHDAVNTYADCDLVICLSLYHLPQYAYESRGRAFANERYGKPYDRERIRAVERGEILSTLRQGLGRSCIRRLDGVQASECLIYVTVPTKSRIKRDLKPLFPGCQVANAEGRLDRQEQALKLIEQYKGVRVFYPDVYEELGMNRGDFSRLMKNGLKDELTALGYEVVRSRPSYVKKAGKVVLV